MREKGARETLWKQPVKIGVNFSNRQNRFSNCRAFVEGVQGAPEVRQVFQYRIRIALFERVGGESPGRDGQHTGSDCTRAGNVVGRVADDGRARRIEPHPVQGGGTLLREFTEGVAIVVIVCEGVKGG